MANKIIKTKPRLLGASLPTSEACCYLATELATMGDLFVLLKKRKALSEKHVRDVVVQLVTAVAGLHRNNICHRDIKPENILLESSGLNPPGFIFKVILFSSSPLPTVSTYFEVYVHRIFSMLDVILIALFDIWRYEELTQGTRTL